MISIGEIIGAIPDADGGTEVCATAEVEHSEQRNFGIVFTKQCGVVCARLS